MRAPAACRLHPVPLPGQHRAPHHHPGGRLSGLDQAPGELRRGEGPIWACGKQNGQGASAAGRRAYGRYTARLGLVSLLGILGLRSVGLGPVDGRLPGMNQAPGERRRGEEASPCPRAHHARRKREGGRRWGMSQVCAGEAVCCVSQRKGPSHNPCPKPCLHLFA